jgi:intracellular multiplication protein IcmL
MADINEPSPGTEGGNRKDDASRPAAAAAPMSAAPAAKAKPAPKQQAADTTTGGALMTVVVRNEFYRDGFRNLMWLAIAEAVIIVIMLVTFISYMTTFRSQDHYFATTADGRIMQLLPLDRPNMMTSALLSWAAQRGSEVMTFGFHDYQRRLQTSSRFFTRHGWETFAAALQQSRIIESVEALQQVVSAQPRSAPILQQEGIFNGKYRWVIRLPLTVKYQSGTNSRTDNLMVELVITRVPSLENPDGVGIEQWVAVNATN